MIIDISCYLMNFVDFVWCYDGLLFIGECLIEMMNGLFFINGKLCCVDKVFI